MGRCDGSSNGVPTFDALILWAILGIERGFEYAFVGRQFHLFEFKIVFEVERVLSSGVSLFEGRRL